MIDARSLRHARRNVLIASAAVFYCFIAAFPVVWMAITAFKRNSDLYNLKSVPFWFNEPPTLEHIELLFRQTLFVQWLGNTFYMAFFVVVITLAAGIPAGYALARLRFRGAENLGIAIFLTYLVPPALLFIPLSRVIGTLGLQDSIWSLIVVYPSFTIPFCTWLLAGYFKSVPQEIEEAARVDGCSRLGAVLRVVLPISLPGILSVVIFAFTLSMQEFVYALTFVAASTQKPVALGVATDLVRGDIFYWGSLMAGALIAGIPVAVVYNFFLDHFVQGITGGVGK